MITSPLRILIAAEHASKRFGGEAILPYHYFRLLRARGLDAHLIVHERTRSELQALFPAEHDRLHFVADTVLQKLFYRASRLLPRRIGEVTFGLANQLLTQIAQRAVLRRLATRGSVIHQPIPVSPRFPSALSGMNSPLIIGPLNGGMEYPAAFRSIESRVSRFAIAAGRALSNFGNTIFPGKRQAAAVLIANERTRSALPSGLSGRVYVVPENGVDTSVWQPPLTADQSGSAPRFLFMGRLVDWKALDIVLEALAQTPTLTLDVVGDGPMLHPWRALARSLNLGDRVTFHGWLTQEASAPILRSACALVLPSIYECGGAVVLEAMAVGKPVIATDWGGPADYLDATCGILLAPSSRAALVAGFASAMQRLATSPETAAQLGAAGREKLLHTFDWDKKIDTILAIYDSVRTDSHP